MSEFTKNKIGFAVALLATLFTIYPVLLTTDRFSFPVFSTVVHIRYLYYCLAILLSASVYFYAIQFIAERSVQFPRLLGDSAYAIALVAPLVYVGLYAAVNLMSFFRGHPPSQAPTGEKIAIGGSVLLLVFLSSSFQRTISRREIKSTAQLMFKRELLSLARARALYEEKNYDLCVIECFRAIEAALRKRLVERGILPTSRGSRDLVTRARKASIITTKVAEMIDSVRIRRNGAVHNLGSISREDAFSVLSTTDEILSKLTSGVEEEEEQEEDD